MAAVFGIGAVLSVPSAVATSSPSTVSGPALVSIVAILAAWQAPRHPGVARFLLSAVALVYVVATYTVAPIGIRTTVAFPQAALCVLLFHVVHRPDVALRLGALTATVVFAALAALMTRDPSVLNGPLPLPSVVAQPAVLLLSSVLLTRMGRGWERALTESARVREELLHQADSSSQASAAKSAFLASMSHELRTPLNAVIGYAELARDQLSVDGTVNDGDLLRIERAGTQLLELVNQVLDLSRVESGHLGLELRDVELGPLVEEVADTLQTTIQRNGNTLHIELDDVPELLLDPLRIRQILTNLLANAAKFTENGTIRVVLARRQGEIALSVRDTGPGVPVADQRRIFEPFIQADSTIQSRYGGTGLGLAISRKLAEGMGGTLTIDSEVGVGSCFTLHFPAAPPPVVPAFGPDAATSPLRLRNREDATGDDPSDLGDRTARPGIGAPVPNRSL